MKTWLKNNYTRLIWIAISFIIALLYLHYMQTHISQGNHTLGLCWLKVSIAIFIVISGFSFIYGGLIAKNKSIKQVIGLVLGFILYTILITSIINSSLLIKNLKIFNDEFTQFSIIILLTSFILLIIDWFIGMEYEVLELDFIFILSTISILKIAPILTPFDLTDKNFVLGFQTGAIAFQLIAFNLSFNPNLYLKAFACRPMLNGQ